MRSSIIALALLSACASAEPGSGPFSHASHVTLPTGNPGWAITCASMGNCLNRADALCSEGYAIVDVLAGGRRSSLAASQFGIIGSSNQEALMMVECQ